MILFPSLNNNFISNSDRKVKYKQSRFKRPDSNNKIFFKIKNMDNNKYRTNYNSINLGDRSIIVKKISLSNIFNINNTINSQKYPISLSLNEKQVFDNNNNNYFFVQSRRTNLYNNRIKKIKNIIIIQTFVRRFLTCKKYYNELKNIKSKLNTKKIVYRKKMPLYKSLSYKKITSRKINKKNVDNNHFFITKLIIVNKQYDKALISKIQKFWRNKKINAQIGNYSRINNYECQSEIIKNLRYKKINLTKKPKYDSLLFSSLKSKEELEFKDKNKNKNKDEINLKNNKEIFDIFYSKNNNLKRPQYIKLYNKNNQTSIKGEYCEENIYNYEVNDIDGSFKGKSFTLYHDKNKNGKYIQQTNYNIEKKIFKMFDNNDDENKNINNFNECYNIFNNLKVWKKNKLKFKFNAGNTLKFKNLKPNKNFLYVNSSKVEKKLKIERKKDIIDYPNCSLMKKINNNLKKNNIKKTKNILSKYFINEDEDEPNLIIERKFFMKKPPSQNNK